jgi:energy-converting hydrogenase Eha subunit F
MFVLTPLMPYEELRKSTIRSGACGLIDSILENSPGSDIVRIESSLLILWVVVVVVVVVVHGRSQLVE